MSVCAKCSDPLEVEIDPDDTDGEDVHMSGDGGIEKVPDDVHLSCGDHFHWECLLETFESSKCPACAREITLYPPSSSSSANAKPQVLVELNNEGGLQNQIDIYPILREESHLRAHPEERKSRAFLELCREGDHRAIIGLLKSCSEDLDEEVDEDTEDASEEPSPSADEVLRYQDPFGDMQSGLHAAAANGHREVAWLLLLLASNYPELEFPALVFQEAGALGVMREDQEGKVDIRSLKDSFGRSAEDVAREAGVVWNGWFDNGRLAMP